MDTITKEVELLKQALREKVADCNRYKAGFEDLAFALRISEMALRNNDRRIWELEGKIVTLLARGRN